MSINLRTLLLAQMRELHHAEVEMLGQLPRMARAASQRELRRRFEDIMRETQERRVRVEGNFFELGAKPSDEPGEQVVALVRSIDKLLRDLPLGPARDTALIAAVRRWEQFQMSDYESARGMALELGLLAVARRLDMSYKEQARGDEQLSELLPWVQKVMRA